MEQKSPLPREEYTVGWICIKPENEYVAARAMLDEKHGYITAPGDPIIYYGGKIGQHNVIIGCTGEPGLNPANYVASNMMRSFKHIKVGLLCGIGGGNPGEKHDIRLGDIVVGMPDGKYGGVVQYNIGKATKDGFVRKASHNRPPPFLMQAVQNRKTDMIEGVEVWQNHLEKAHKGWGSYKHLTDTLHQGDEQIPRPVNRASELHYGLIGSGDLVVKFDTKRAELVKQIDDDVLCFEMEAAGLVNTFPCLVVRGISDYCDEHKNDAWQAYASSAAAAYCKYLLKIVPVSDIQKAPTAANITEQDGHGSASVANTVPRPASYPSSTVPFQRDEKFVGREEALERINTVLSRQGRHNRFALTGLGGIGKSQVAIEYSYRLRERDPQTWVFWIHASNRARFVQGFEQIARVVKLPGKEEPGANILRLVCDWLCDSSNGRWLLVVDNADDRDVLFGQAHVETGHANYREAQAGDAPLSSYLPQSAHGAVLITSRNQTGADLAGDPENVETLDQFDEHDALLLLRKRLPGISVDEAAARDLVHTLDCIPLAIAQATAYIMKNKHRMTITKYLATFNASESKQLALLDAGWVDLTRDHSMPNAVLTSWKITFDQISQNDALAANILSMMSVLDRQGVPEMLIRPDEVDELDFDEAIGTLLAYSLVFSEKDGVTYAMHRLVQISTRRWLEIAGKLDYWRTNALTVTSKKFPSGTYETWKTCEVLLPHARMVLCYTLRTVSERDELSLLSNVGWYIGERGDYREASQLLRTALEGREKVLGKEHRNTLTSVSNLASVLSQQGKYEEAEQMNRRALEGWEKVLRKEHPYTLRSVNNLASVLRQQGKCEEAEQMHRRALEGWEKVLVKEHPDTLTSVNNLAHLLERKGDYNTAAKLYRRACSGREKVLGRDHPDTIACQWDYSLLLQRLDKNGEDHRRTDPGSHSKSENIGADDDDLFYDACSQSSGQRE